MVGSVCSAGNAATANPARRSYLSPRLRHWKTLAWKTDHRDCVHVAEAICRRRGNGWLEGWRNLGGRCVMGDHGVNQDTASEGCEAALRQTGSRLIGVSVRSSDYRISEVKPGCMSIRARSGGSESMDVMSSSMGDNQLLLDQLQWNQYYPYYPMYMYKAQAPAQTVYGLVRLVSSTRAHQPSSAFEIQPIDPRSHA